MICLYVHRIKHITHLLGFYPIGSCIPRAQQSQQMTVFFTITVIVIVGNTNVVFITPHGFLATFLLWWRHGRWLLRLRSRRHKPRHQEWWGSGEFGKGFVGGSPAGHSGFPRRPSPFTALTPEHHKTWSSLAWAEPIWPDSDLSKSSHEWAVPSSLTSASMLGCSWVFIFI